MPAQPMLRQSKSLNDIHRGMKGFNLCDIAGVNNFIGEESVKNLKKLEQARQMTEEKLNADIIDRMRSAALLQRKVIGKRLCCYCVLPSVLLTIILAAVLT